MYDVRIDKIVLENPSLNWLKDIATRGIVVLSPNTEKYLNDPNQLTIPVYTDGRTISKQFILDIISHDDSFDKIKNMYETNSFGIYASFIGDNLILKDNIILARRR